MTVAKGSEFATYREITAQPEAWRSALSTVAGAAADLQMLWQRGIYRSVLFTGCGSTYYLSLAAAALFQELTGFRAQAVPAGDLVLYPQNAYVQGEPTLLVAVSRSAETTETLRAVSEFQAAGRGEVVTISNYGDRPLASMGRVNLVIAAGQEESVAQTRSFASMYVAATALAATLAARSDLLAALARLPDVGAGLLDRHAAHAQRWGADLTLDRFYFLGSGPRYGLACEVNLKMKEMSLTHSEPFHFLEFRHGPISMVGPSALVVGLLSESRRRYEEAVLDDVRLRGGRVVALADADADVVFASALSEPARNVLYLPVLQLMAYHRALAKGLNPDRPHNLETVVKLDWSPS